MDRNWLGILIKKRLPTRVLDSTWFSVVRRKNPDIRTGILRGICTENVAPRKKNGHISHSSKGTLEGLGNRFSKIPKDSTFRVSSIFIGSNQSTDLVAGDQ